jgi:transcriptional regulator with XRE-family HTH domain
MVRREPIDQIFRAALLEIAEKEGWGFQTRIAKEIGASVTLVNDIIKGRRGGAEETRRAISEALGIPYEDMIQRGRELLGWDTDVRGILDQKKLKGTEEHSNARAALIYRQAGEHFGLRDTVFMSDGALSGGRPPGWTDYMEGKLGDLQLFKIALAEMKRVRNKILEAFERERKGEEE